MLKSLLRMFRKSKPRPVLPDLPIVWTVAGARPDWRRVRLLEVTYG